MPFTRKNAYMVLSSVPKNYRDLQNDEGFYLRTIHNSTITPLIAKISFPEEKKEWESFLDHAALKLSMEKGQADICFAAPLTILIRGTKDCTMELDFLTEIVPYDYIYEIESEEKTLFMANCYKNNNRYLVWAQKGSISLDQKWEESSSLYSRLRVEGEDGFLLVMKEIFTEWDGEIPSCDFETAKKQNEEEFLAFYHKMPVLSDEYEEVGYMASFLNWSSIVAPVGFLKREAMYMSKNWMTNVWSWDHCFNAMALAYGNPEFAWDTYMIMADFQDETGRLPDSVSDVKVIWNYCKPPVHGWALRKMMEHMTLTEEQMEEAYVFLSKWTDWWMKYRKRDGLYYYNHGNDSGWDNSTAFSEMPPVATPELQADLIVQMDVLADLARKLGKDEEMLFWQKESKEHMELFLAKCFRDNLPVAIQCSTGKIVENKSLLPYEVLVLGTKLPEEIRNACIRVLKSDEFFTEYGFATESPKSEWYRDDGYWRGPIWAPSTMLLIDGLDRCGEKELVKETAKRFLTLAKKSGFAENYNALTGEGLRDKAYTWTASVALILAKEYLS